MFSYSRRYDDKFGVRRRFSSGSEDDGFLRRPGTALSSYKRVAKDNFFLHAVGGRGERNPVTQSSVLAYRQAAFDCDDVQRPGAVNFLGYDNDDSAAEHFLRYQLAPSDDEDEWAAEDFDSDRELSQLAEFEAQLLYSGASVTIGQAVRLIRGYAVRSFLRKKHLGSLLQLLSRLLPEGNYCPSTLYKFEQAENLITPPVPIELDHCCATCGESLDDGFCVNDDCGERLHGARQWSSLGYGFSDLECQLRFLLQEFGPNILRFLDKRPTNHVVSDIVDSRGYKRIVPCNPDYNAETLYLTLSLHYDSSSLVKSNNVSVHPIQLQVLELPPPLRNSLGCLIAGSMFVGQYVNFQVLLLAKPLVKRVELFNRENVQIRIGKFHFTIKLRVILLVADLPAKAKLVNMMQHNSYHGCLHCVMRGQKISAEGERGIVFPYSPRDRPLQIRSPEHFRQGITEGEAFDHGFKDGGSILSELTEVATNLPYSLGLDVMHQAHEGVLFQILARITDSHFHAEVYYLVPRQIKELDEALKAVKFPSSMNRRLRKLKELCNWKAAELRNFLIFGVPLLVASLHSDYFHHLLMFTSALELLCGDSLNDADIDRGRQLLDAFCKLMPVLYDERMCTMDERMCLHLADQAAEFGPLGNYSAYAQESNIGYLKHLVSPGTGYLRQSMEGMQRAIFALREEARDAKTGGIKALGKAVACTLSTLEFNVLQQNGLAPQTLRGYKACRIYRLLISTRGDGRFKSDSSLVMYTKEAGLADDRRQVTEFGRVSCFFENPNDGNKLYAVIRPLNREGSTLRDVADVPRNPSIRRHYEARQYGTNPYLLSHDESNVVDVLPCSAVAKHAAVINVPGIGRFVKAAPLASTHD